MLQEKSARLIKTELMISNVLRYGVLLCIVVIGTGLLSSLFHFHSSHLSTQNMIAKLTEGVGLNEIQPVHSISDFLSGIKIFNPEVIMAIGLLLLISLPIARVGLTVILFLFERDWVFLALTLFVFNILIFGLLYGQIL